MKIFLGYWKHRIVQDNPASRLLIISAEILNMTFPQIYCWKEDLIDIRYLLIPNSTKWYIRTITFFSTTHIHVVYLAMLSYHIRIFVHFISISLLILLFRSTNLFLFSTCSFIPTNGAKTRFQRYCSGTTCSST